MVSRRESLRRLATGGASAAVLWRHQAFAAVFTDIEQAQRMLLPGADRFEPVELKWDADAIARASGTHVPRNFAPRCWAALQGERRLGWVLADHVVGKYEFIDYAAGFDEKGVATGVEILVYRESHGSEIRNAAWRKQFAGASGPAQMRFNDDIRNISGATLSCRHLTEGMQRLAALVQQTLVAQRR